MYATHIFDGIDNWPTHILRIWDGTVTLYTADKIPPPFYLQAAKWLQEEADLREKTKSIESLN